MTENPSTCMFACIPPAVPSRITETKNLLQDERVLRQCRVGKATSMLIDGRPFRDALVPAIVKDPTFLLRTR